jgi:hypothetical protein
MPDEFDNFLRSATDHLDFAAFPDPAALRVEGSRRRRRHAVLAVTAVVLLVAAVTGAGARWHFTAENHPVPGNGGTLQPTPASSMTPDAASPTTQGSPSTTGSRGTAACTADQLSAPALVSGEGAAGSATLTVTVTNRTTASCVLSGVPTLWGHTGSNLDKWPQRPMTGAGGPAVLGAGRAASLTLRMANAPCPPPAALTDLLLDLGSGPLYQSGATLVRTCGTTEVSGWDTDLAAPCTAANFSQQAMAKPLAGGDSYMIMIINASSQPCLLSAGPLLRYTDSAGHSAELPGDTIGVPATLPGHGGASMTVTAGQSTGCAPTSYHNVSVQAGTVRLSVPGTLAFSCPPTRTGGWSSP